MFQRKKRHSNSPPFNTSPDYEREKYSHSFLFEYGNLDDETLWIRTPSKDLYNVDWLTLRLLMELNAGMSVTTLCQKYKVDPMIVRTLLTNLEREKAIVKRGSKISRAEQIDDINIVPFIFLFFILIVLQIEYFQNVASTFQLRHWYETLVIGLISFLPIIFHELGHYLSARPYFPPRIGFTSILFFPAVYIDTHASWCLPRNIRLLINLAGILMDLGVNTLLVLLVVFYPPLEYYVTPLLILQYIRWSIIMNPLVSGDGYWLLSDFSRTVNMRKKGIEYLKKKMYHWLSIYGLFSLIFSVFSILGLIWFVLNLFRLGLAF